MQTSCSRTADASPIFLLTGPPGAGKSSVANALLQHFPTGIHIPVDDLREWVVSGIAHPVPQWTEETGRQFHLARRSAASLAQIYHEAHFAVVIDDILFPEDAEVEFEARLPTGRLQKVLLLPSSEVALMRNHQRTNKSFDTEVLTATIRSLREAFASQPFSVRGWLVIDNSTQSIEQTVETILAHTIAKEI